MTDIAKLKAAALAAGGGEWCAFIHTASKTYSVHTPDDARCGDVVKWAGFDGQTKASAKARFIAAANPAAVLELIAALEAAEKRIAELLEKQRLIDICQGQGLEHRIAAEKRAEAAEKRVAELEVREVREEGNQFLVVRYPGKLPVIKHCTGDLEKFLHQLIEQDKLVTIDIVTHRYYGVGGQWVEDANEYLQMMAAAGITLETGGE